jgi:transposase
VASGAAKEKTVQSGVAEPVELRRHALAPDLEVIGRFIKEMIARGAIAELIASILGLLQRMREINTELAARVASHTRRRPPNEALRRLQLELPLAFGAAANDVKTTDAPMPTTPELEGPPEPPGLRRRKKKRGPKVPRPHGRSKVPAHLPREPHVLSAGTRCCPKCGGRLSLVDYKRATKLEVRPMQYFALEVLREVLACQDCHEHVCVAPKPDEVVDRGVLGNELMVQALVDHYDDGVPWERMERNAAQQDVPLKANTLAASVGKMIDLFDPVVAHIKEATLSSGFTALDATRMPVLDPEHPLGIRSGSLWLLEGDHQYACFVYAPTGHADHLAELLRDRKLASVMCDGSPTNNCVERAGGRRGGCNAHARRGLVAALRGGDLRAVAGLDLFGRIFHVDAESKRLNESVEQRFARRQREAVPIVNELEAWVKQMRAEVEPKSTLGKALGYIARQWPRLTAFLRDPRMELTNNEVERDLRRWVLDRKVWLFVGHEQSARRAANALTLLTTCRKMGLDPRRYLREALAKVLAGEKKLVELLPETFARAIAAERAAREGAAAAA